MKYSIVDFFTYQSSLRTELNSWIYFVTPFFTVFVSLFLPLGFLLLLSLPILTCFGLDFNDFVLFDLVRVCLASILGALSPFLAVFFGSICSVDFDLLRPLECKDVFLALMLIFFLELLFIFYDDYNRRIKRVINFNSISIFMSIHRIRLNQINTNNQSFSHQQSLNQNCEQKHRKKGSIHQKQRRSNCQRIKTDQRDSPVVFKNEALSSYAASMHLAHTNFSASKLSKMQQKMAVVEPKKTKKSKQTISVINLSKNIEDSKGKNSTTVTKRKQSAIDLTEKIKEKVHDFKIISTCMSQYVKEERRNNSQANLNEIIKIIGAFNRSEIAPISKPLEKLIGEIVSSIQYSLPQPQIKSILKKSITIQSPHQRNPGEESSTIKKPVVNRELRETENPSERKLQDNLTALKYESNRLRYFFDEISQKNKQTKKAKTMQTDISEQKKIQELKMLQEVADQQQRIMQQFQSQEQSNTFRSDSPIE